MCRAAFRCVRERARSGTDVKLVRLLKFETVFLDIVGNDKCYLARS